MAELTVHLSSHNFSVRRITPRGRAAVEGFARRNVQYGLQRVPGNRYVRAALRVYAAATQDRTEFRFHLNQLKEFEQHLAMNFLTGDLVEWIKEPIPTATQVSLPVFASWTSHDYQVPVIEYLKSNEAPRSKFVDLQTGKGKSYCSLRAISDEGVLPVIIVKPMYLEKWIIDIRKTYDIEIEDLMVIRGSSQLMALLLMAEAGAMDAKMVLVSNKTIQNWLKLYEKFGQETLGMGYACTPDRFFELLGAGQRLIDEVHQDFHLNFKIDLYTNVQKSISLSATLLADDDFVNKMYEVAYPSALRYKGPAYDKYISAKAVIYKLKYPEKARSKDPVSKNYSHHVFEQYILRNQELASNYLKLINQVLKGSYLVDYQKGQKLIIFCASIDMCTVLTDYLRKLYPQFDVRRYVEEDPYDNLMDADIRVTTLLSAGTAVDIPNLTTTILTVAVSSSQSNVQGFGRLRKLKDGVVPEFLYFCCEDIEKHVAYHERKKDLLKDRALNYKSVFINEPI